MEGNAETGSCVDQTIDEELSSIHGNMSHSQGNTFSTQHSNTKSQGDSLESHMLQADLCTGNRSLSGTTGYNMTSQLVSADNIATNTSGMQAITTTGNTVPAFQCENSQTLSRNTGPAMETHYVIVEEPMDLNSFGDFSSLQMNSVPSMNLSNEVNAEAHILNTPRAEETDKDANGFSAMDLLVADNDMSNHADEISDIAENGNNDNQNSASFQYHTDELNDSRNGNDIGLELPPAYQYQLDDDVEDKKTNDDNENDSMEKEDGTDAVVPTVSSAHGQQLTFTSTYSELSEMSTSQFSDASKFKHENHISDILEENDNNKSGSSTDVESSVDTKEYLTKMMMKNQDQEKINQEKTTFSENLGLIPAQTEMNIIAQRARKNNKGVRTRKSFDVPVSSSRSGNNRNMAPVQGHKHTTGSYKCGSCGKQFIMICKLHDHLQEHCFGGSYHYDHLLRTAFPKYDTTCSYSQTSDKDRDMNPPSVQSSKVQKSPIAIKLKAPKSVLKKSAQKKVVNDNTVAPNRKRGRPRKVLEPIPVKDEVVKETPVIARDMSDIEDNLSFDDFDDDLDEMMEIAFENVSGITDFKHESESVEDTKVVNPDKITKESESDISSVIGTDSPPKRARKRKMSVPRKVLMMTDTIAVKKANARTRPENKISCEFCPSVFHYTRGLIKHEQEKHADEMKFQCDICEQKFMREYNLERHKLCAHTEGKANLVGERKGIYRQKRRIVRKSKEKVPDGNTICEFCNQEVPNSKLDIHMRLHTGERPFICHVCGKGLISDKKLKRHLLIHNELNRHTCEICGQGFSMKYKLRTHMYIHTGHKPYLCSVCGAEFNNSTSLLHHHRTVHLGDKRFECNICGGRYGKKSQLDEHLFSHSNERTQTCRYCGKSFKHAKSLRRHEITHVSDAKFACDQCDSKFSRKDNLERHKMCHVETAIHCTFCKKKFKDRQPLIEHEQFHIMSRRFQCQICKDKFQDETYFYNHMEQNHGVTKEMVPMINSLATNSPEKPTKSRRSTDNVQTIAVETLKIPTLPSQHVNLSTVTTSAIDTLNLSMSVAGIIPSSSASHHLGNINTLQTALDSQSNVIANQNFNTGQNPSNSIALNSARILNQPLNPSFAAAGVVGMQDIQRVTLVNPVENGTMRMSHEDGVIPIALGTGENIVLHEQHRLMQEAIGSGLQVPNQGYRLQNMY